jgi:pimeloyl-ACP methyl ester carboxylesterase
VTTGRNQVTVADGTTIAWEECGDGPALLLIMGLGADRHAWRPHVDEFSKSFRCILPDNRGAGESGAPEGPYSTSLMAADMAAVVRAAGAGPVAVIGISLGGAIAQQLAIGYPELVRKLILVSTWLRCRPFSTANFEELKEIRPKLTPDMFTRRLQLLIWSSGIFDAREQLLGEERRAARFEMSHEAFAAQCDAATAHDTSATLPKLTVPTLVTAGSHDAFTPMDCSRELVREIPGARLEVFDGLGHVHHWEDLDRFNQLCGRFLGHD